MNLHHLLQKRLEDGRPVRVALIGAGKFGSMFLSQVPTTNGLEVAAIADLHPDRAREACRTVGWPEEMIAATQFVEDGRDAIRMDGVEVVVDATGSPSAGVRHALAATDEGRHVVMVNVEADVLAGPLLARKARAAGVVYSMAYGDQPSLTAEIVDWARACGFHVVAAGKGTRYLPSYHASTPDTVWDHYGKTPEEAEAAGMNPQMFNSFVDGTKSCIEMAAIANATGLNPPSDGLSFPPLGTGELASKLKPVADGGILEHDGQVEVVSSLRRDGSAVMNDLRWGVYAVFRAPNDYAASCFQQYGMVTDQSGEFASMYRPYHLIGLELNVSILSAALRGEATGETRGFAGDAVATAKRSLTAGEALDGEGGFTVWGKLIPAARSLEINALPIGLAHNVVLKRDISEGDMLTWDDVEGWEDDPTVAFRREMERTEAAGSA